VDENFKNYILGDSYVSMTLQNIAKGDPMAVYKSDGAYGMFLGITLNNIFVSFRAFVMGIFTSIATAFLLIQNGIMVGAFQYLFYEHGLLTESALTIWIHGSLEIPAIIIAGAAGIAMGNGWLFPKTYRRIDSFRMAARRGLKIITGTTPIFIIAGFLEAYLTRHTELPHVVRLLFILACLSFVVFYFIIYPRVLHRKQTTDHA
jgi:uncharacterized membrane protein SpoIIM required for sporulation